MMDVSWEGLPRRHRSALLAVRHFGGTIRRGVPPDLFTSGTSPATLDDLVDEGFVRKGLLSWSLTLKGWRLLGDRRLRW